MWRFGRWQVGLICLAGLMVNAFTLGPGQIHTLRGDTDFMPSYAGGKLAFSAELYTPERVLETEAQTEGRSNPARLFVRLPCFAVFFWPLAQLPYSVASALWEVLFWEVLCALSLVVFCLTWPARRKWVTAVACCWSLPIWMTLAEGQDIGFVLLWMAVAAALLRRKHPVAAGLVASLCLAKFHLFLPIPVWICARRQWRFAYGIFAGAATLLALSFAANGRDWPLRYLALLREPGTNPFHEIMPNLNGLFAGMRYENAFEVAALSAIAIAVWSASRRRNPNWGLAAALAGGLLAAPHAYMADGALLVPAGLMLWRPGLDRWTRAFAGYLLTPIPWVLLMIGSGDFARLGLCALVLQLGLIDHEKRMRPVAIISRRQTCSAP
jgi:hypothetical protein